MKYFSVYGIIWTTTPWTLPANCAICYNESLQYSVVKKTNSESDINYIVASELLTSVSDILGCNLEVIETVEGKTN